MCASKANEGYQHKRLKRRDEEIVISQVFKSYKF